MERVKGIEPSSQAWEARILPLNHTRFACFYPIASITLCKDSLFVIARRVDISGWRPGVGCASSFQLVDSAD